MREYIVERALPCSEASDALNDALKAHFGEKCFGISARVNPGKVIRVHLADDTTPEDDAVAYQIVMAHDFNTRTDYQIREAERRARREALRALLRSAEVTTDPAALARRLEWLTLEVAYLLERAGE